MKILAKILKFACLGWPKDHLKLAVISTRCSMHRHQTFNKTIYCFSRCLHRSQFLPPSPWPIAFQLEPWRQWSPPARPAGTIHTSPLLVTPTSAGSTSVTSRALRLYLMADFLPPSQTYLYAFFIHIIIVNMMFYYYCEYLNLAQCHFNVPL